MQNEYLAYTDKFVSIFVPPQEIVEKVKLKIEDCGKTGAPFIDIPHILADDVTIQGYGRLVDPNNEADTQVRLQQWPSLPKRNSIGGFNAGTVSGNFMCQWINDELHVINEAVNKPSYKKGWRDSEGNIFTQGGDYHPDGEQVFIPIDRVPFILILCKYIHDDSVSPLNFVAFQFKGDQGFAVKPDVYHQAVFPLENQIRLNSTQGKVHGVVMVDCYREFNTYLRIKNPFCNKASENSDSYFTLERISIPNFPTTEINIGRFGKLISNFQNSADVITLKKWPTINDKRRPVWMGDESGVSVEKFTYTWRNGYLFTRDKKLAAVKNSTGKICITMLFRRLDGNVVLFSEKSSKFTILLALDYPDNAGDINPETLSAFTLSANCGIAVNFNVWYSLPIPVDSENIFVQEVFNAANAYVESDIFADLGYLAEI